MSETLRPCPFCSGNVSFHADEDCDGCHYIECKGCGAFFDFSITADPRNESETIEELRAAIAPKWNGRAPANRVTDDLLVSLFYAASGNISQFRIKARALLEGAPADPLDKLTAEQERLGLYEEADARDAALREVREMLLDQSVTHLAVRLDRACRWIDAAVSKENP